MKVYLPLLLILLCLKGLLMAMSNSRGSIKLTSMAVTVLAFSQPCQVPVALRHSHFVCASWNSWFVSGWRCEASLFCEAPQWLAKQTTDVRLSLWESKLAEGAAENFVTTPRSLSPSVCLCRRDNQVLFLTNERARDGECLHSVRIRCKVLLPWATAGL